MDVEARTATPRTFERFAAVCALIVGLGGVGYAIAFLILVNRPGRQASLDSLFLLPGGLLTTAIVVALYVRLRHVDPSLALWGALLGVAASIGSAIHGGYELGIRMNPPEQATGNPFPNPVDPRGLMTFGVFALWLFVVALLINRGGAGLPRGLAYLGFVSAGLMVLLYLGRLTILHPSVALQALAGLEGALVNPAWFIWLGLELRREPEVKYVDMTEER